MNVIIEVNPGQVFTGGDKEGQEYTSVRFNAKNYGASSPCQGEEDIQETIQNYKEWIKKEGDTPTIQDNRTKQNNLSAYL